MGTNATSRDSRAGYTLYRDAGGAIDKENLNRQLFEAGYGPISDRMMTHYRHLADANFDRYISINRFDVARAASRYEDLGASPRYQYREIGEGVRMLIAKGNKLWVASAEVTRLGEAGAIVRLVDEEYRVGLEKARIRPGDFVSLRFLESGRSTDGRIVEVDLKTDPPLIEVRFTSLVSLAELASGNPLATVPFAIRLRASGEDHVTTDQLGRRLFLLFELIDEVRYIANYASEQSSAEGAGYSAPAVVDKLSVASPAEAILAVSELVSSIFPFGAIAAVLGLASKLPEKRKAWHEGTGVVLDNEEKRVNAEIRDLEKQRAEASLSLVRSLRELVESQITISDELGDELDSMTHDRVVPIIESLAQAGVEVIEQIEPNNE